jgi:uncharacterized protein (TIGR02145 family)
MKKIVLIFLVNISVSAYINAQSVGINTDTPEASAVLDIVAPNSDKGVIAPRMTTLQRNSIVNPAEGLLVYDTELEVYTYWNGTIWRQTMMEAEFAKFKYAYFKFTGDTVVPTGSGAASIAEKIVAATSIVKQSAVPVAVLDAGSGGVRIDASGQYAIKASATVTNLAGGENQALQAKIITYINGVMISETYFHLPTSGSGQHQSSGKSYVVRNLNYGDIITVRLQKIIPSFGGNGPSVDGNKMTGRFNNVILELDRLPYDCAGVAKCTVKSLLRPEGLTFMCYNLGANPNMTIAEQMAYPSPTGTGVTDATVYGDLYQWGRIADGHEKRNSPDVNGGSGATSISYDANSQIPYGHAWYGKFVYFSGYPQDWHGNSNSDQNDDLWNFTAYPSNNPCPAGWRVPTQEEWGSIFRGGTTSGPPYMSSSGNTWTWNSSGTPGYKISVDGGTTTSLFLPATGNRSLSDAMLYNAGQSGLYWSTTVNDKNAHTIIFISINVSLSSNMPRTGGNSVRCIEDY